MKIAIAHDTLTEFGGAERFLQSLLRLYPDAHVYVAYMDRTFVRILFPMISPDLLHTSYIQKMKLSRWGYLFQPFAPIVWRGFNFENYDVVISSSSSYLSNTIRVKKPIHIQYIHTPPKNIFHLSPKTILQKYIPYERFLSDRYKQAINNSPYVVANSKHMQQMLKLMFGVSSRVIYPPVVIPKRLARRNKGAYCLMVCRLDEMKGIEIVIQACNRLRMPLKIVGIGSDEKYVYHLHKIAGSTIEFLGFRSDLEIHNLYENTIAFLFATRAEDFGVSPVEAMAHGVPVIAFYGGGAKETVVEGKTGSFYYEYTLESLAETIRKFSPDSYDPRALYLQATKFSEERFHKQIRLLINSLF